ncbi:MAG: alpha-ketoacid dehydrogenase subunit beta, partial [Ottowia sp.]|nr:alpha-ketoacid dehydrogenase subunit beta [Ottowia sp.]
HSQSLEAWYAHVPGLVVVAPATPADNYGLLKSAIRCDDPVVYMEHKDLWPALGDVPADAENGLVPLGQGRLVRRGDDVTVVTWSRMVQVVEAAAAEPDAPSLEIIDLRTLWPWDRAMVLDSVRRTGRCLVVHEAVQAGGFGGEIAATVGEALFGALKAPVRRLGAPRIPVAYAPVLEAESRILPANVAAAARAMV